MLVFITAGRHTQTKLLVVAVDVIGTSFDVCFDAVQNIRDGMELFPRQVTVTSSSKTCNASGSLGCKLHSEREIMTHSTKNRKVSA